MTTETLTERVPVTEITARAREIKPGAVALALAGGLLFGLAWLLVNAVRGAWFVLTWIAAAFMTGWDAGAHREPRPSRAALVAAVAERDAMIERLGG